LQLTKYIAKIKLANTLSLKLFASLGFHEVSRSEVFGEVTLELQVSDEVRLHLQQKTAHCKMSLNTDPKPAI